VKSSWDDPVVVVTADIPRPLRVGSTADDGSVMRMMSAYKDTFWSHDVRTANDYIDSNTGDYDTNLKLSKLTPSGSDDKLLMSINRGGSTSGQGEGGTCPSGSHVASPRFKR